MKIAVVLFLLVLTLDPLIIVDAQESAAAGGAAAADAAGQTTPAEADGKKLDLKGADAKKVQEEFCNTLCLETKDPVQKSSCMESCAISQKATLVLIEGVMCLTKCEGPNKQPCKEDCNKLYAAKAAEVTAACNEACVKLEKDPVRLEGCKMECTPPPTPN